MKSASMCVKFNILVCFMKACITVQIKHSTDISRGPYITPPHISVQVPGDFNKVGSEKFGDEYCGEDSFKTLCLEESN